MVELWLDMKISFLFVNGFHPQEGCAVSFKKMVVLRGNHLE